VVDAAAVVVHRSLPASVAASRPESLAEAACQRNSGRARYGPEYALALAVRADLTGLRETEELAKLSAEDAAACQEL